MNPQKLCIVFTSLVLLTAVTWGDPSSSTILAKPIPAYVGVLTETGIEQVEGSLTVWDQQSITIQTRNAVRQIPWKNISASSAYALRAKLIDHTKASGWLELGTFGWQIGAKDARNALTHAAQMDPTLKDQVADILKTASGSDAPAASASSKTPSAPKYVKSTPEQDAAAIAADRQAATKIQAKMQIQLAEVQTDHFLIFTDWNRQEYGFLKENLEGAYAAVSKQFDIPVKENVFIGKLPVFMLATQTEFGTFSSKIDGFPTGAGVAGYYYGDSRGIGHLVMFKPGSGRGNVQAAEREWAYVLTHEFTHAFVARYRNNQHLATWLNEGIAEVIASSQFPDAYAVQLAKQIAASGKPIDLIFKGDAPKPGVYYPIMRTVTETLIRRDRKAFLALVDSIKAGTTPQAALEATYKWDYAKLEQAWRIYCATVLQ